VINEPEMLIVEKIFRLAAEGLRVAAIQKRLYREGIRTKKGKRLWARAVIQDLLFDDAYKLHAFDEIAELVSSEVAARVDRGKVYGINWYNRQKVTTHTISVSDGNGGRTYRKRRTRAPRPREEWIAIPVPAYLPRTLVDAARAASAANNGTQRTRLALSWELRRVMRCPCGWKMTTHTTKGKDDRHYYYYECSHRRIYRSISECTQKLLSAEHAEAAVWESVRTLMSDPEAIRVGWDAMIEEERAGLRGDPDQEAKGWLERIADLDQQRARAQDLAVEGLLSPEELRTKLSELADARETAHREIASLEVRKERVEQLERDRDAALAAFPAEAPERLDRLTGLQRNKLYRTLQLEFTPTEEGFEVTGPFCTLEVIR
jgi:site-specific DNA recombinase